MSIKENPEITCAMPKSDNSRVLLAHGGGGKLMHQLLDKIFFPAFESPELIAGLDGAIIEGHKGRLAFSTDSYVVDPLFFPGGNIGSLAINGTINDLAMCGARPLYLSVGFIIEEGFAIESLEKIVQTMHRTANEAGVKIVTGDTKVVDKGKGSGLFINTAGIGIIEHELSISPRSIRTDDAIIINGDIGRHGIAVMTERGNLGFDNKMASACAQLASTVNELIKSGIDIHCLHDLTRGGLATALVEIAEISKQHIRLDEDSIPVHPVVHSACEILGIDPAYVANEGRFVAFVPESDTEKAIKILRSKCSWPDSSIIGRVTSQKSGIVTSKGILGAERLVDMLSGEQLPRIC